MKQDIFTSRKPKLQANKIRDFFMSGEYRQHIKQIKAFFNSDEYRSIHKDYEKYKKTKIYQNNKQELNKFFIASNNDEADTDENQINLIDNLKPGTHLASKRFCYVHHGIYIGQRKVIEYRRKEGVREADIEDFCNGHEFYIVQHFSSKYSEEEAVSRAKSRLGEHSYGLFRNNCEHFVNWCLDGEKRSEQVVKVAKIAKNIISVAVIAIPLMVSANHIYQKKTR